MNSISTLRAFAAAALLTCLDLPSFGQSKLDLTNYTKVFEDEFDSYRSHADLINNSQWQFRPGQNDYVHDGLNGPNAEAQYYDPSAVTLATVPDGNTTIKVLKLTATRLANPFVVPANQANGLVGKVAYYTSGWISFKSGFVGSDPDPDQKPGYRYGIFEIRCKLAPGQSTFPAFWLYGGQDAELDVFENQNGRSVVSNNIHAANIGPGGTCERGYQNNGADLTQAFHTYAMAWAPDRITFFMDGCELRTLTQNANLIGRGNAPVIANLAVLNNNYDPNVPNAVPGPDNGWPSQNPASTEMQIDYIRVYKPTQAGSSYPSFKIDQAWATSEVGTRSQDQVTTVQNSISADASGQVVFSDPNGLLHRYVPSGSGGYTYSPVIQNGGGQNNQRVHGDVVLGDNNTILYKGNDQRIQYFYLDSQNNWYHDWADYGWDIGDNSSLISNNACALAVVPGVGNSILFYRGQDNRVHLLQFTGSSTRNGWTHSILPLDPTANSNNQYVKGDVITWNGSVFYVGVDGRLQRYARDTNGNYVHTWIGANISSEFVSFGIGTIVGLNTGLYYRGQDNRIHHYFLNGSQWTHELLTTNPDLNTYLVAGSLVGIDGNLFYRGTDSKMQTFYQTTSNNTTYWVHDWLSSWGAASPATTLYEDNFTVAGNNKLLFYKNTSGYVNKFEWGPSAAPNLDPPCNVYSDYPIVYRSSNTSTTLATTSPTPAAALPERVQYYSLAPNPAANSVTLHSPTDATSSLVSVYSLEGKRVLAVATSTTGHTTLDIHGLSKGIYMVFIEAPDAVKPLRLVVE